MVVRNSMRSSSSNVPLTPEVVECGSILVGVYRDTERGTKLSASPHFTIATQNECGRTVLCNCDEGVLADLASARERALELIRETQDVD